jgi:hypothetical protein
MIFLKEIKASQQHKMSNSYFYSKAVFDSSKESFQKATFQKI